MVMKMRPTGRKARTERRLESYPVPRISSRPKALICKAAGDEVLNSCLLWLNREAEVEQVATLAEAMQRCLNGRIDILFVNLFSFTAGELTALAAFRELRPESQVVAIARPEMRPVLLSAGLVDEVYTAYPVRQRSLSWA